MDRELSVYNLKELERPFAEHFAFTVFARSFEALAFFFSLHVERVSNLLVLLLASLLMALLWRSKNLLHQAYAGRVRKLLDSSSNSSLLRDNARLSSFTTERTRDNTWLVAKEFWIYPLLISLVVIMKFVSSSF